MSKGYQQRVGIAQAILHSPPVIILDEPTVGLDPIQILEIRQLIKTLGENHGIILCTHILPEVQAVCNRVQIINQGELVYRASIADMMHQKTTKYEISLSSTINKDELMSHNVFKSITLIDDKSFLAESDLKADKLTQYIVKQQWGLTRFDRHKISLEHIFIDLTTGDTSTMNKKPQSHTENNTTS